MYQLRALPAMGGDCFLLDYCSSGRNYHIWIDSGMGPDCYDQLAVEISALKKANKEKKKENKEKQEEPKNPEGLEKPEELEHIDCWILTHIDEDHIQNLLALFADDQLDSSILSEFWFNYGKGLKEALESNGAGQNLKTRDYPMPDDSGKVSFREGRTLDQKLEELQIQRNAFVTAGWNTDIGPAKITILSPNVKTLASLYRADLRDLIKENEEAKDRGDGRIAAVSSEDAVNEIDMLAAAPGEYHITLTNRSSIAFLFELDGHAILFSGDADPRVITKSLKDLGYSPENRLKLDYLKVSHHGSRHNTDNKLLDLLECEDFIISTFQTDERPHKETLSRIAYTNKHRSPELKTCFWHNYEDIEWDRYFTEQEREQYNIITRAFSVLP